MFPKANTTVRLYSEICLLIWEIYKNGFQNFFGWSLHTYSPYPMGIKKMFSIEEGFHANAVFMIAPRGLAQINSHHPHTIKQIHLLFLWDLYNQSKRWVIFITLLFWYFHSVGCLQQVEKIQQIYLFKTSSLVPGFLSLLFFLLRTKLKGSRNGYAVTRKEIQLDPSLMQWVLCFWHWSLH